MGFELSWRFGSLDKVELFYQRQGIVIRMAAGVLTNVCLVKIILVIVAVVIDAAGKTVIAEEL